MNRTLGDWRALPVPQRAIALEGSRNDAEAAAQTHGAFISVTPALQGPPFTEGLMHGIPIAVKDNIDVAGFPTTGGTSYLRDAASTDADVVSALVSDGAVVIGKTNLHELAFGITSNNAVYGPVRNPADPLRSAGGSSGGSAAAVALGIVPLSIGSDTGASISVPAAFCGIVGLRPTTGRYPSDGLMHLSWTRDTTGLHANTVSDLLWADQRITGETAGEGAEGGSDPLIGVPSAYYHDLDHAIEGNADSVLASIRAAGFRLVQIDLPGHFEDTAQHAQVVVGWEAPRAILSHLAEHSDRELPSTLSELAARTASPDVAKLLTSLDEAPVDIDSYRRARHARWRLRRAFVAALDCADVAGILFPTTPVPPPLLGQDETLELNGEDRPVFQTITRHTGPGTFMGMPMVTFPTARGDLPMGFTLMARPFQDVGILRLADVLARAVTPPNTGTIGCQR